MVSLADHLVGETGAAPEVDTAEEATRESSWMLVATPHHRMPADCRREFRDSS